MLLAQIQVLFCEANMKMSVSPVQSRSELLPRFMNIISEFEWCSKLLSEDPPESECSMSWDHFEDFNERKCEMSKTEDFVNTNEDNEENLEDLFTTITPTSPNPPQTSGDHIIPHVNFSLAEGCSTPKSPKVPLPRKLKAPQTGPYQTPDTTFTDSEDEAELRNVNERKCEPLEDPFITKMAAAIKRFTPNAICKSCKEVEYPQVDLNHLNSHFIKNIPKPQSYPIHGCSQEPEFYDQSNFRKRPTFYNPFPFGADQGYDTNVGVVKVPDQPIFGYIWSDGEFKIFAAPPSRASCTSSGAIPRGQRRGRSGG